MSDPVKLSIVVPAYNESGNIIPLLSRFAEANKGRGDSFELIIVDNNSTDSTAETLARERARGVFPFARSVFEPRAGYGAAIKRGLSAARGDVLGWTHADLQTDPRDVFRAYDEYAAGQGERIIVKGKRVGRPMGQVVFSFGMGVIASVALRKTLFEINAQPKLFHRSFYEAYLREGAPDDFSLDLYLLYRAKKRGYSIQSIPVKFDKRAFGESTWAFSFPSKLKTVLRTLRYIFKLSKSL